jgi:hypothetical protein
MIPVETNPGMGAGRIKENGGGGEVWYILGTFVNATMYPTHPAQQQKHTANLKKSCGLIQDGKWSTEADSMSFVNQGPCWDARAMLGRSEAPRRVETFTPWTPSPWKAFPYCVTLREQVECCHCHLPAPNLLGRWLADQTGKHQASRGIPPATYGINQHSPLVRLNPTLQKKYYWTINNKLKISAQQRGGVAESTPEKRGRARSW